MIDEYTTKLNTDFPFHLSKKMRMNHAHYAQKLCSKSSRSLEKNPLHIWKQLLRLPGALVAGTFEKG